jgi:hypothetical protein
MYAVAIDASACRSTWLNSGHAAMIARESASISG